MPDIAATPAFARAWRQSIAGEISGRVLPFWQARGFDENGGIIGRLTNDLRAGNEPRTALLAAEMVWVFSRAARVLRKPEYARLAEQAYATLNLAYVDHHYGGVFYAVDDAWRPSDDHKHIPSQMMAILALVEFYRAGGKLAEQALEQAKDIFGLAAPFAADGIPRDREWRVIPNAATDAANSRVRAVGAFAALAAEWRNPAPKVALLALANAITQQKPTGKNTALELETSWQMSEAAPLGDARFAKQVRAFALEMAGAVLRDGIGKDNILRDGAGVNEHIWRTQTEGVIGFYNAYQLSGDARFLHASRTCWNVIEQFFIDYSNGEWFKTLNKHWQASPDALKIGPTLGPFHQARMGFEMMERLGN
ncbi:MAG TPA: AGE family epimerase/isomerase [Thermoflexales bacterium]|nr:AGE family epimerase/isomerase [Thermoflexales bacterium]